LPGARAIGGTGTRAVGAGAGIGAVGARRFARMVAAGGAPSRGPSVLARDAVGSSSSGGGGSTDRGALQPRGATAAPASSAPSSSSAASSSSPPPPASPSPAGGAARAFQTRNDDDAAAQPQRRPPRLRLRAGASMLPHPDKAHRGGEDAFFIADGPLLHARSRGRAARVPPTALDAGSTTSCAAAADAHADVHDRDEEEEQSGARRVVRDPHHPHHHAAFGVADGVGGWAEVGVDAGAYARMLMDCARDEAERAMTAAAEASAAAKRRRLGSATGSASGDAATTADANADAGGAEEDEEEEPARLSAQDILERAFHRTDVQGSSTACVLVLNGATLAASNLGDSGFSVVRGGQTAFQSPQQQHNFNFPYQLGSAESMSDQPQAAMRFEMEVAPGDIVVVGSDGLWDNVFAEEAAAVVTRCWAAGQPPDEGAATLARYARMRAADAKHHSPFSYAAVAAGYVYAGGKMDDISVVVAYVEAAQPAAADAPAAAEASGGEGDAGGEERPRSRL